MSIKPLPSGPSPRPDARASVGKASPLAPRGEEKTRAPQREETPATDNVQVSAAARELQAGMGVVPSGELAPERLGEVVGKLARGGYEEEEVRQETVDRLEDDVR